MRKVQHEWQEQAAQQLEGIKYGPLGQDTESTGLVRGFVRPVGRKVDTDPDPRGYRKKQRRQGFQYYDTSWGT